MPTPISTLTPLGPYSNDEYIEALINYIASTPENINYNALREMLWAMIDKQDHPYIKYYLPDQESSIHEPIENFDK